MDYLLKALQKGLTEALGGDFLRFSREIVIFVSGLDDLIKLEHAGLTAVFWRS